MLNLQQLVEATGARLLQKGAANRMRRIAIDSRRVQKGSLFIALIGKRLDGHRFVPQAIKQGACCLLVSRKVKAPATVSVVLVKDTTRALGFLARAHRRQFDIPVIAITGSAGKTTTKEMIAAVLGTKYRVLKNHKTENNHIGVPLTLLKLNRSHQAAVIEFGTNQPGDILWLAKITEATMAVFTNIGDAHLEKLTSRLGIFKEKSSLLRHLDPGGTVIFNNDDPYLRRLNALAKRYRRMRFSVDSPSEMRAYDTAVSHRQISFKVAGKRYRLNSLAAHNISNALAAISCGSLMQIPYNKIRQGLNRFKFPGGRFTPKSNGKLCIIDDTYNANPLSMRSAVASLAQWPGNGRRIAVCADMLELGSASRRLHAELGRWIAGQRIDHVFTFGTRAKTIGEAAAKRRQPDFARHFARLDGLTDHLKAFCRKGDILLVKGSRSMAMERVVESLMN